MEYRYDLLEPVEDVDQAINDLQKSISTLYPESWEAGRRQFYNKPFDLNIQAFVQMWLSKTLKIFMAYDEDQNPVGFLIGMVFRPIPYNAQVFQIEDWYAKNPQAKEGLLKYLLQAMKFMGCDELWYGYTTQSDYISPKQLGFGWNERTAGGMQRFCRG